MAVLSSFTIEPLLPYLRVEAARAGFDVDVHVPPFDAGRQALVHPNGPCVARRPDVVIVAELLADVCPVLAFDYLSVGREQIARLIDETVQGIAEAIAAFRRISPAHVIVPPSLNSPTGLLKSDRDRGQRQSAASTAVSKPSEIPDVIFISIAHARVETGAAAAEEISAGANAAARAGAHRVPAIPRDDADAVVATRSVWFSTSTTRCGAARTGGWYRGIEPATPIQE